jgi:hypothetical protein
MLVSVTVHHGERVQHNPFEYVGEQTDFVREYDMDYFSI